MRAVLQRVRDASVTVEGKVSGAIGSGLLVYLGIGSKDDDAVALALLEKIANLRIFEDTEGKMNLSLLDTGGEMLVVSQFTLYADTRKGRRPSYDDAAPPAEARELYGRFVDIARDKGITVATGTFQATMDVTYTNEGPVTIILDTEKQS